MMEEFDEADLKELVAHWLDFLSDYDMAGIDPMLLEIEVTTIVSCHIVVRVSCAGGDGAELAKHNQLHRNGCLASLWAHEMLNEGTQALVDELLPGPALAEHDFEVFAAMAAQGILANEAVAQQSAETVEEIVALLAGHGYHGTTADQIPVLVLASQIALVRRLGSTHRSDREGFEHAIANSSDPGHPAWRVVAAYYGF